MLFSAIERLREGYEGKYVSVDSDRRELARFKGLIGRVATVNCNGRALVMFDAGDDRSRYDIEIDYLKVVDKPGAKPADKPPTNSAAPPKDQEKSPPEEPPKELSPLELARLEKEGQ